MVTALYTRELAWDISLASLRCKLIGWYTHYAEVHALLQVEGEMFSL